MDEMIRCKKFRRETITATPQRGAAANTVHYHNRMSFYLEFESVVLESFSYKALTKAKHPSNFGEALPFVHP